MVIPERLNKVPGKDPLTARLDSANNQGSRSKPIETISNSSSVTRPSLVALAITPGMSMTPTSTQPAMASVNNKAGENLLKISKAINATTISATSAASIAIRLSKDSAENTRS